MDNTCNIWDNDCMKPDKVEIKRNTDGTFVKGEPSANPLGRPKGKTLKEFVREHLMSLSDEEKLEYIKKIPKDMVWKMAEGNPKQDSELDLSKETLQIIFDEAFKK